MAISNTWNTSATIMAKEDDSVPWQLLNSNKSKLLNSYQQDQQEKYKQWHQFSIILVHNTQKNILLQALHTKPANNTNNHTRDC